MSEVVIARVGLEHAGLDFSQPLKSAVIHPLTGEVIHDEVTEILGHIDHAIRGTGDRQYVAAIQGFDVLGVMGFRQVGQEEDPMAQYTTLRPAIEVVNALSRREVRGIGVGKMMLRGIERWGLEQGNRQVVLNSGPRYRRSGWPFWRSQYGEPVAVAKDFYGPRLDAPVWRHDLEV